jgi:hypothetical protein
MIERLTEGKRVKLAMKGKRRGTRRDEVILNI